MSAAELHSSKQPAVRRKVFPPLPPNASKPQKIIRAFEEKQGKLLAEMTPNQLSAFTNELTQDLAFNRPTKESIAFFKGTAAEPLLRRQCQKLTVLLPLGCLALILPFVFGIATAFEVAAMSQSPVLGLLGGFVVGLLLWSVISGIASKLEDRITTRMFSNL